MLVQVCELDIIFNFEKAYFILDEFLMGGEIQDTSKKSVLKAIEQADLLQEVMWPWYQFISLNTTESTIIYDLFIYHIFFMLLFIFFKHVTHAYILSSNVFSIIGGWVTQKCIRRDGLGIGQQCYERLYTKRKRAETEGEGLKMGWNMFGLMALVCCIFVTLINEKLLHLRAFQISIYLYLYPSLLVCELCMECGEADFFFLVTWGVS